MFTGGTIWILTMAVTRAVAYVRRCTFRGLNKLSGKYKQFAAFVAYPLFEPQNTLKPFCRHGSPRMEITCFDDVMCAWVRGLTGDHVSQNQNPGIDEGLC